MLKKLTFTSLLFISIMSLPVEANASGNCPANAACSNTLPASKPTPVASPTPAATTPPVSTTTVAPVPTATTPAQTPIVIVVQVPQATTTPTPVVSTTPVPTPVATPSATNAATTSATTAATTATAVPSAVQSGVIETVKPEEIVYKTIPGTKEIITKTIIKEVAVNPSAYIQSASTTDSRLSSFTHNFFLWFWLSIFAFSVYTVVHKKIQNIL
jgi:hypothetical protein